MKRPTAPADAPALFPARGDDPGDGAWFLARNDALGLRLRVHGLAPGDLALVRPRAGDPGWGELADVVVPGRGRRAPPCLHAAACGGCPWLHLDEERQDELRRSRLERLLRRHGADPAPATIGLRPCPAPRGGRHRARFQLDPGRATGAVGMHGPGSWRIADLPDCPQLAPPLARAYAEVRGALPGLAPHGLTGLELTAVPGAPGALAHLNPRDLPPAGWPVLGRALLERCPALAGIAVRGRPGLAGPDVLGADHVLGRTPAGWPLAASARGFLQSNLAAADLLADEVARLCGAAPGQRVVELFAGSGLLGWRIAAGGADVTALESDPDAVRAGGSLPAPPAGSYALRLADARDGLAALAAADVLVTDPPRAGLGALAGEIARAGPRRIVHACCSAASFARDVGVLLRAGYALREIAIVGLFPQTPHTEAVALLEAPSAGGSAAGAAAGAG
ncbi:MAG: class I SAM-dependent RNA methyltransferase [Acidobacteria bacterium]|nr:class I SAM-dependent RNA methyltransferase [Acidobacteriota bacterium]